ncbi:hypothetical protein [Methanoregula sp.]|uniref:hypothetical protein n=1 Tax=Methanoregula sp. TaxID=2052170 RepID=UPI0035612E92
MTNHFAKSLRGMIPVAALVFLVVFGLTLPVSAVEYSISEYNGNIPAGGTISYAVLAGNSWTDEPVDLLVDVVGIGQTEDLKLIPVDPIKDTYTYSARKFTSADGNTIHVDKGTKKQILLTFKLPQDVGNGGRYAMVVIHTLPGKNVTASDTNIPVFLTILGSNPNVEGSITSLAAENVTLGQLVTILTGYKNTGNIHQSNVVNVVNISGSNGNFLISKSTEPLKETILPEKTYEFSITPDISKLPAGTYTVLSKVYAENGKYLDKKTTTFTIKSPAGAQVSATPLANATSPPTPAATKSGLPAVLGLAALAGAMVLISCRKNH